MMNSVNEITVGYILYYGIIKKNYKIIFYYYFT